MRFTKMHGIGNDYVYVNGFVESINDPAAIAVAVSNRHFGIGADGLILILRPGPGVQADVRMRMFNADGSESEMCGNGIRCVAKYAFDHGLSTARPMRVQTGNGVLSIDYTLDAHGKLAMATVDMGQPILEPAKIPVDLTRLTAAGPDHEYLIALPELGYQAEQIGATFVSMGNPHAVIFQNSGKLAQPELGRMLESHPAFPRRINVHFVRVDAPDEVTVYHWERGSGATLACGTGACAICVAGVLTGRTARTITAHLPGGDLRLEWREADNRVYMTGPAVEVFNGEWHEAK